MKRVISVFLPNFATDRLTRPNAALAAWRAEPFLTVHAVKGGLRVAAVNDAARAQGIHPDLPVNDARAICPNLKATEAAPDQDQLALTSLAEYLGRYTPWTSVESLNEDGSGGIWLDITGCAHLFGGEEAMIEDLVDRLRGFGLTVAAGLADTPGAAWAMARYSGNPDGKAILPEGAARQLLSGLPIAALRLPPAIIDNLRRLGLRRLADLLNLPRAPLTARFGPEVTRRLDQILGHLPEPITPLRPITPYLARMTFLEPIGRTEDVEAALRRLLIQICERLAQDGLGARQAEMTLFRVDGSVLRQGIGTAQPVRDPDHLFRLFREDLDKIDAGFGIEAMSAEAIIAERQEAEQSGLGGREHIRRDKEVALLVDRLDRRLGPENVYRMVPRASHLPEGAMRPARPLGPVPPIPTRPRRPLRLLRRPEPIRSDGPAGGLPQSFSWRRGRYRLIRAEGPERISPEWWHGAAPPAWTMRRDYWRCEDDQGRRFWLFCDQDGQWFLHGFFA